ncbi:DNA-binding protein [Fulvitalea axinellae]|uniref:DNA-binding protein n=1 Tax=Fulvitalea axinellae TaxID=1182444 RepID=A0AAU9CXB1_9BACT|nr:DNA-binding protein [Fulvitalea axinellae]
MENTLRTLRRFGRLSTANIEAFAAQLERVELPRNTELIREGEVSPYFYFLEKGATKTNYIDEYGDKKAVWFAFEGELLFSFSAYFAVEGHQESIELYEDSVLYRIPLRKLRYLYDTDLEWANWGRLISERFLGKVLTEMDRNRFVKAKDRYRWLIESRPDIHKRVPLKDIASYLGISKESLSRIRKEQ